MFTSMISGFFGIVFLFIVLASLIFLLLVIGAFSSAAKEDPGAVTKTTLDKAQQSTEAEQIRNEQLHEANRQAELKSQREAIRRLHSINQPSASNFGFLDEFRRRWDEENARCEKEFEEWRSKQPPNRLTTTSDIQQREAWEADKAAHSAWLAASEKQAQEAATRKLVAQQLEQANLDRLRAARANEPSSSDAKKTTCSCEGQNENCARCFGAGWFFR